MGNNGKKKRRRRYLATRKSGMAVFSVLKLFVSIHHEKTGDDLTGNVSVQDAIFSKWPPWVIRCKYNDIFVVRNNYYFCLLLECKVSVRNTVTI